MNEETLTKILNKKVYHFYTYFHTDDGFSLHKVYFADEPAIPHYVWTTYQSFSGTIFQQLGTAVSHLVGEREYFQKLF